jgi:pimeloyl-ACP methyl ester carboxylesterase
MRLATRAPSNPCKAANASDVEIKDPPDLSADDGEVGPSGRSILLSHGAPTPKVFVLLHGLAASPLQFVEIGRRLYERGANVLIPRLPRHGHEDRLTSVLEHLTAEEMTTFARDVVISARTLGDRVIVAGFSVGGLLASWLAQHEALERAVPISPFLGIALVPRRVAGQAARLALRMPNRFLWWNPVLREGLMPAHGYPRYATHAVAQAYVLAQRLFGEAEHEAPATRTIDVVLNRSEVVVNNRSAVRLAAAWRARGAAVRVRHLRALPPSHDIVEPLRETWIVPRVYPQLVELIDGEATSR